MDEILGLAMTRYARDPRGKPGVAATRARATFMAPRRRSLRPWAPAADDGGDCPLGVDAGA